MSNLPSPSDLQYFIEVAGTSNLSRAAERLGISQPALSLAMQRLETSFGVKLLIRGKTGVKVTHAGQKLTTQARVLLGEWEKIRESTLREQSEVGGSFTLGCHPSVALYSLPGFLPGLIKAHPKLEFKLVHDLSRKITEDVISFRVDFGIVVNPVPHPDLVIVTLCTDEVRLWCVPGADKSVLIYDPDLMQSQAIVKQATRKGLRFERLLPTSSLEVAASLAAGGVGVGLLPTRVAQWTRSAKLAPLAGDTPKFQDSVCLTYRADAQRSRASKAIGAAIIESFRESSK
jgi:DNA-binding transcriptional LysR family regulator